MLIHGRYSRINFDGFVYIGLNFEKKTTNYENQKKEPNTAA